MHGKLKQRDERDPHLHEERCPASTTSTIGTPARELDVETVVKASQALSGEIVLPKSVLQYMIPTRERVVPDDDSVTDLYAEDE